ncbi:hypothetical protein F8568_005340 [Actinomadura sp. LD22]|uniref:Uncharacterized protein n=1 Tax=Actinomadura physcomitrii TaxID=2650748 RepID=A0A6I4M7V7_9ACTN|nr:hypothetical protein [Actinomadura physcomitrii]MVZ99810.1 hypothetical protein [Actinomadura physcomitrii]
MKLRVGQTLKSAVDETSVVVIKSPGGETAVTCGGHEMTEQPGAPVPAAEGDAGPGLMLGKRYTVEGVEIELLCSHGGRHAVAVDGAPVEQKSAKPLPASD